MPSSRTCAKPASFTSFWKSRSSCTFLVRSATMPSQPSHLASSSFVHSDASCAQSLRTHPLRRHSSTVSVNALSIAGGNVHDRLEIVLPISLARFSATAQSRSSAASANSFTPSSTRCFVTAGKIEPQPLGFSQHVARFIQAVRQRVGGNAVRRETHPSLPAAWCRPYRGRSVPRRRARRYTPCPWRPCWPREAAAGWHLPPPVSASVRDAIISWYHA